MNLIQVSCPINSSFDFSAERALVALSAHTGTYEHFAFAVAHDVLKFVILSCSLQRAPSATRCCMPLPPRVKCHLVLSQKW
jgi:hypothetical protein